MNRWRQSRVALLAVLLVFSLAGLLTPRPAMGDTAPPQTMVRAHLEPSGPVVAGSQVKLVVDLLTTTWFTEAPNWPLFAVPDALVSLPDEQAVNLSETIDGVRWFGVSRAYRITPQTGKTYDIPSFSITVYPGGMSGPLKVATPTIKLVSTLPTGAQGMRLFFPTQTLVATQTITPSTGRLRVGDVLTRTITQRAAGTESMLIPPVAFGNVDGLKRGASRSSTRNVLQDRVGLVAGERTDSASYFADRSGKFRLPPVAIEWWNTVEQKRETIVLPAVTFSAAAVREKPLFDIPADALSGVAPHRIILIHGRQALVVGITAVGLLTLIGMRVRIAVAIRGVRQVIREASERYANSDVAAWRVLRSAARMGRPQQTIPALYQWLDRTGEFGQPALLDNANVKGEAAVARLCDAVARHYEGGDNSPIPWRAAASGLHRNTSRTRKRSRNGVVLPLLNAFEVNPDESAHRRSHVRRLDR